MKKAVLALVGLAAVLTVAAIGLLYGAPGTVVGFMQAMAASSAGVEAKTITVDGYDVHYYEGGSGPTVVLLHGMADEKNSFVTTAKTLTDQYRVILPDLQGHGKNARDPQRDHSIRGQVQFLEKVFAALDLETFTLGGNSMGGHTSVAYTLAHPEQVAKLILVNAPGLKLDDHVVYGGFGAKMETRDDFFEVMDRVVVNRPSLPGPIIDHMIAETNKNFDFINGLAEAVKAGGDFDLKDRVAEIKAPTLILWGKADPVVKFNVAEAYDTLISDSKLIVIDAASHSPQMEKPEEIGLAIKAFLKD